MISRLSKNVKELVELVDTNTTELNHKWEGIATQGAKSQSNTRNPTDLMKSIAVQTEEVDTEEEASKRDEQILMNIEDALQDKGKFDKIETVLDLEWPERVYRNTKMIEAEPAQLLKGQDNYILLMDPSSVKRDTRMGKLDGKYEGLLELAAANEGKIEHMVMTTKTKTSRDKAQEGCNILYIIPMTIDEAGVNDVREIYFRIEKIAEIMETHKTSQKMENVKWGTTKLVIGKGLHEAYTRKICEYVFQDSSTKIEIMTSTARSRDGVGPDPKAKLGKRGAEAATRTKPPAEKVIVKAGGRNYADLLKTAKASVDVKKSGLRQKSVASMQSVRKKAPGMEMVVKRDEVTLHISDIDGDLNIKQVVDAITTARPEIPEEEIRGGRAAGYNTESQSRGATSAWASDTKPETATDLTGKIRALTAERLDTRQRHAATLPSAIHAILEVTEPTP
ncbi:hypothetical protein ILUMI_18427 [Ignelater luminosus]|uniref:Uncharacterized protein n=1 Tax=Ignelater luminosus TaxID=2038154 RepID=A0A8K0G6K1_IGNLU|nr:hypothetical protein ILUMI_18427 [Ignelater luminosus]